jgi:hypothetical protein
MGDREDRRFERPEADRRSRIDGISFRVLREVELLGRASFAEIIALAPISSSQTGSAVASKLPQAV